MAKEKQYHWGTAEGKEDQTRIRSDGTATAGMCGAGAPRRQGRLVFSGHRSHRPQPWHTSATVEYLAEELGHLYDLKE